MALSGILPDSTDGTPGLISHEHIFWIICLHPKRTMASSDDEYCGSSVSSSVDDVNHASTNEEGQHTRRSSRGSAQKAQKIEKREHIFLATDRLAISSRRNHVKNMLNEHEIDTSMSDWIMLVASELQDR